MNLDFFYLLLLCLFLNISKMFVFTSSFECLSDEAKTFCMLSEYAVDTYNALYRVDIHSIIH